MPSRSHASNAFKDSKGAIAFATDLSTLWTPGGSYNLYNGSHQPPPDIFLDPEMSSLTFSRNAAVVGGIRANFGWKFTKFHKEIESPLRRGVNTYWL